MTELIVFLLVFVVCLFGQMTDSQCNGVIIYGAINFIIFFIIKLTPRWPIALQNYVVIGSLTMKTDMLRNAESD